MWANALERQNKRYHTIASLAITKAAEVSLAYAPIHAANLSQPVKKQKTDSAVLADTIALTFLRTKKLPNPNSSETIFREDILQSLLALKCLTMSQKTQLELTWLKEENS
eukprot:g63774.t1